MCDAKNSRLGHGLPPSVNGRVITPLREDFIFNIYLAYGKFRENKTLAKISESTVLDLAFKGHRFNPLLL